MRDFTEVYDHVYVDIDDTIIYGWFTDIMRYSWDWLRSNLVSHLLMYLQCRFNIYRLNRKLLHSLKDLSKVTFLTVRAKSLYTNCMIYRIILDNLKTYPSCDVVSLGTDNGALDKAEFIANECYEKGYNKVLLIDDSLENRKMAFQYGYDVLDPRGMYEKLCG